MLIGLNHKFVFVANLRTASSATERVLRKHADISIPTTQWGKHMSLSQISRRFRWLGDRTLKEMFVFGVIRDPASFLISLYNFHTRDAFKGEAHYTGGKSFDQFLEEWVELDSWQVAPQVERLTDADDRLHISYVVRFSHLQEDIDHCTAEIGIDAGEIPSTNSSPCVLGLSDLSNEQLNYIESKYAADYEFIEQKAGRFLR